MGCGIEYLSDRQFVYFTKNGKTVSISKANFLRIKSIITEVQLECSRCS